MKNLLRKRWVIPLGIYLIALLIRFYRLSDVIVYPDEITWIVRGKEFFYALAHHNIIYFKTAWWTSTKQVEALGIPLSLLGGLSYILLAGSSQFSLKLFPDIIAARLPIIFLVSLTPVLIYLFGRELIGKKSAVIASFMYLTIPWVVQLDQWFLHDSILTLFSVAAVYSFYLSLRKQKLSFWPGIFLGLAFLTKPSGAFTLFFWLPFSWFHRRDPKSLKILILNLIYSIATISILWPAMWFNPILAIPEYFSREQHLGGAGVVTSYYFGQPTTNPNPSYYLSMLGVRLPEIIILGVILSFLWFIAKRKKVSALIGSLVIYWTLFLVLSSLVPQKLGIRYVLPLIPWICLLSAWGIIRVGSRMSGVMKPICLCLLISLLFLPLFEFLPNYYLYYNSLSGGPEKVKKIDLVGLCFGSKAALKYLDKKQLVGTASILGCIATPAYYSGRITTKDFHKSYWIILESAYKQQFPKSEGVSFVSKLSPLTTISENGVITAWIYQNPFLIESPK